MVTYEKGTAIKIAFTVIGLLGFVMLTVVSAAQQGWSEVQRLRTGNDVSTLNSVFFEGKDLWVVGGGGLLLRSRDYGESFESVGGLGKESLNDVFAKKDRIWVVGDGGIIAASTDGGQSFLKSRYIALRSGQRDAGHGNAPLDLYSIQFLDKNRGFVVGDQGLIITSSDGGHTWREVDSRTSEQLFHLTIRSSRGWVVGTGGTILHSDDDGNSWYPQRSGTDKDLNRVYFVSDKVGVITGDDGLLLRTDNGGATWETVKSGVTLPLFGISFIDKKTGWVVGYNGTVIRTYDGGETWIRQESTAKEDIFGVSFNRNRGFAIGRGGLLLRYYEKR